MISSLKENAFRLSSAQSISGYVVRLSFEDGKEFDLDLTTDLDSLTGPLVDPLKDPCVFSKLCVEYGALVFPTGLDYGADVLRVWCENGGITDQKHTDQLISLYRSANPPWSAAA